MEKPRRGALLRTEVALKSQHGSLFCKSNYRKELKMVNGKERDIRKCHKEYGASRELSVHHQLLTATAFFSN